MPAAIDSQVKKTGQKTGEVINQWLSGDSRDRIADDNGIGACTVSNISISLVSLLLPKVSMILLNWKFWRFKESIARSLEEY
jgi:hypothetical protein